MDLVGQPVIKHKLSWDAGVITLEFLDDADTSLGTIDIEQLKFRALMEALVETARTFYPDAHDVELNYVKHRTILDVNQAEARSEFG